MGEFDDATIPSGLGVGAPTQTSPNESASTEEPPTLNQTQNTDATGVLPTHPPNEV